MFSTLRTQNHIIIRNNWLPLKDLFCNQQLEFGITLSDLKIAFENLGLQQPHFAIA